MDTPWTAPSGIETGAECDDALIRQVQIDKLPFHAMTEADVIKTVRRAWSGGAGGTIVPINVDVLRSLKRSPDLRQLLVDAVVVPDGMPLLWAARLAGNPLPERVTGSSLIFSISAAAAEEDRSIYLLGGAAGVPRLAAEQLQRTCPGLRVAGTDSPPFDFDQSEAAIRDVVASVQAARPDVVFVGLGFPRQERLIARLRLELPAAWFLACGAAIPMAAGIVRRASPFTQRSGLEWAHRLVLEPRRLAKRYLRDDMPYALALLATAPQQRISRWQEGRL